MAKFKAGDRVWVDEGVFIASPQRGGGISYECEVLEDSRVNQTYVCRINGCGSPLYVFNADIKPKGGAA
jgi:hypothetical protein